MEDDTTALRIIAQRPRANEKSAARSEPRPESIRIYFPLFDPEVFEPDVFDPEVPVPDVFEPDELDPDVPVLLPLLRFVFEEFEPLPVPVELPGAPLELELFVYTELELV